MKGTKHILTGLYMGVYKDKGVCIGGGLHEGNINIYIFCLTTQYIYILSLMGHLY